MTFGRLLGAFVGIIILILLFVVIFGHGKKTPTGPQLNPLPDYASTDATVSFTIDGLVNADELHRSIRITVSNTQMTLDVLQGYNPRVIQSKSFENNQEAYTVFLKAINSYGFLNKLKNTKYSPDERGVCPLGFRYILDLNQDGDDLSRTWATTCGSKVGTSGAAIQTIQTLFKYQIPNYQELTNRVDLSATSEQAAP
jgi:hypothetical protein